MPKKMRNKIGLKGLTFLL